MTDNQEQGEPVAWMDKENHDVIVSAKDWDNIDPLWYWMYQPLYTTPQPAQKPWVGLTDEELRQIWYDDAPVEGGTYVDKLRQVEAKLKEKNT